MQDDRSKGHACFLCLELDRFTKGLEESEGTVEKWCYALKHMWKLHDLPDGLRQAVCSARTRDSYTKRR